MNEGKADVSTIADGGVRVSEEPSLGEIPDADAEYTIQQAASLTGLSEHTLRYYERVGLLHPIRRNQSSGHRRYSAADLSVIETLACLRTVGMSIDDMRRYFQRLPQGASAALQQQLLLEAHRRVLERRLHMMQRHLENLDLKIEYWRAVEAHDTQAATAISKEFSARVREMATAGHADDPDGSA
jgi:DNA-binding transcriptional MerR regulator